MDLIYANSNMEDIGVIQDYSFDMCYGDQDNTFEVKVQAYNPVVSGPEPIGFNYYVYINNTEYGGIVDRIESDTKTGEVIIKGRTWHGILNGCVIEPGEDKFYRTMAGEANEILQEIVDITGLSSLFIVDDRESDIYIVSTDVRYGLAYDTIRAMFERANAKMYCFFQGGRVHIGALLAANYAMSDEFDKSQVPFKIGYTNNNVNHIVCMGGEEDGERVVIHLWTDADGDVMPYIKPGVTDVKSSDDYILDRSQQQLFGKDEISYLYSYSTAEIIHNYRKFSEVGLSKPAGWNNIYVDYYTGKEDPDTHEMKYTKMSRTYKDKMRILTSEPEGWTDKKAFENYYYMTDSEHFESIKELPDSQAEMMFYPLRGYQTQPTDWKDNYTNYWYPDITAAIGYKQLTEQTRDIYYPYNTKPRDWSWNWAAYYTRTWNGAEWVYSSVEPKRTYTYEPAKTGQRKKPSDWNSNWGNYYMKITEVTKITRVANPINPQDPNTPYTYHNIEDHYIVEGMVWDETYSETLANGTIIKYSGRWATAREAYDLKCAGLKLKHGVLVWKKGVFYTRYEHQSAPKWPKTANTVFYKYTERIVPTFEAGRYYSRILNKVPPFKTTADDPTFTGYWEKIKDVEQIPEFNADEFFIRYDDRCATLVKYGLQKLEELRDTSTLDISLSLGVGYDVGDIVGSVDNVTGVEVNRPILRKIIKIKKDIVSINYEVN